MWGLLGKDFKVSGNKKWSRSKCIMISVSLSCLYLWKIFHSTNMNWAQGSGDTVVSKADTVPALVELTVHRGAEAKLVSLLPLTSPSLLSLSPCVLAFLQLHSCQPWTLEELLYNRLLVPPFLQGLVKHQPEWAHSHCNPSGRFLAVAVHWCPNPLI